MVTESETLRKIHTELGVTGSFKDRGISEWLQKNNPSELEYQQVRLCFQLPETLTRLLEFVCNRLGSLSLSLSVSR